MLKVTNLAGGRDADHSDHLMTEIDSGSVLTMEFKFSSSKIILMYVLPPSIDTIFTEWQPPSGRNGNRRILSLGDSSEEAMYPQTNQELTI